MEPNESGELQENAEHAQAAAMRPVAFTMSVLAVMVAITTVLGHRTHTEAVLNQNKATDEWNLYQAKKIRSNDTELTGDLLSVMTINDPKAAQKLAKAYADHQQKWNEDLKEESDKAGELEATVERAEQRADRFDLGEALLEIALVVSSITLLTRNRMYWVLGIFFGVAGVISALSVLFFK